jgi:hypothetical protein
MFKKKEKEEESVAEPKAKPAAAATMFRGAGLERLMKEGVS